MFFGGGGLAWIHSKIWPYFSVEELALIFSWRVGLKIQQKGSPESFGGVGLNSFQELALISVEGLALIFSWRVGLKIQQKGSPESFQGGDGLNSFQELTLIFSWRVGLKIQQKGSPECFVGGGWPEFIPKFGLNFQLKS